MFPLNQSIPRCSMYGIFTYIWVMFWVNVGKYSSTMEHMGLITPSLDGLWYSPWKPTPWGRADDASWEAGKKFIPWSEKINLRCSDVLNQHSNRGSQEWMVYSLWHYHIISCIIMLYHTCDFIIYCSVFVNIHLSPIFGYNVRGKVDAIFQTSRPAKGYNGTTSGNLGIAVIVGALRGGTATEPSRQRSEIGNWNK